MPESTQQRRFLGLLEAHRKILFKVAASYCRDPVDRQDLIQEMVFQLWRSFERYDERRRFSTWMYRVALNVAISFSRSEARRSRTTVRADDSILELAADAPAALVDELALLRRLLGRLDELDRALLILYLDGNRHETIAGVLGISKTNVGTRISRIKKKLRREGAVSEGRIRNGAR